jgi:hypothetical protein
MDMTEWKTIDSVTDCDGESVLIALRNGGIVISPVSYFRDPLTKEQMRLLNLEIYRSGGSWPDAGFLPTHWMPLPGAPKQ